MTALELFAAVGLPLVLFVLAWGAVRLMMRDIDRHSRLHPGE
jgi:hypothetical protein